MTHRSTDLTRPAIFIVDDDPAVRDSTQHLFESLGLAVEAYGSSEEFPETANPLHDAQLPSWRGCLLLDLRKPDAAGLELLGRLAAGWEHPPIIIIAGHDDLQTAVRAMNVGRAMKAGRVVKAGAVDFIEKPLIDDVIVEGARLTLGLDKQGRASQSEIDKTATLITLLTPREREVLDHLIVGRKNKEIAFDLGISPRTVEIHRARVMTKMQARNLSQLVVRMAVAAGINAAQT